MTEKRNVPVPAKAAALPDKAEREAILSRAHVLAASRPVAQKVRLPMVCSATGVAFYGIAETEGEQVRLIGHELPDADGNGAAGHAPLLSSFTFTGVSRREWNCPICRQVPGGVEIWGCSCASYSRVLHCGGRRGRKVYCACGEVREADFYEVPSLSVTGQSMAAPAVRAPAARVLTRTPALLPSPSNTLTRSK
jgi:hypothetical protein